MAMLTSRALLGPLSLNNRIVLPPMATELATEQGHATEELIAHYVRRAAVGLVIIEHSWVCGEGKASLRQLGAGDDAFVPGLSRLVAAVKEAGARVVLQINHAGSAANPDVTGLPVRGPSAVMHPRGTVVPVPYSEPELGKLASDFGAAATRARDAGFDGVEIHGAHGYLLSQFLSPLLNVRCDRWGGDLMHRAAFPLTVVDAVREAVGPDYPILYRLGADDFVPGGLSLEEGCEVARLLAERGVNALDVSAGVGGFRSLEGPGFLRPTARACRRASGLPVLCAGGFDDPAVAEQALSDGDLDLVAVGRAMLADPDWVVRARESLEPAR